MTDLVIVSMHVKGFPQADLFLGCADMSASEFESVGPSPDDFFTMVRGTSLEGAFIAASKRWPQAKVVYATQDDDE